MRVHIEDLTVTLDGKRVVHGVNLDVQPGRFIGLLGPNGSGKSSLLRTVYRVHKPSSGTVRIDGLDLRDLSARETARLVAVMTQELAQDFPLTALEVALLGRVPHQRGFGGDSRYDLDLAHDTLESVGAGHLKGRLFAALSGGEKQRILLARALVQETPVLILDEPTNHLDIGFQLELMTMIRERGLTTIAALHDLNLAATFCDDVVVLNDGGVAASGTPHNVLTPELISDVFGVAAHTLIHPSDGRPVIAFSTQQCTAQVTSHT
ncbi:ABC transporter ATP-binding protein [Hoyosella rhizosphaerae]|uniref:ABC transporter ATP-binding protein n=1 Tax=Hoyosella rhizosphaerae TaxID=1755582 RepID=A0A916X9D7_9ACTN|nr:ABC transporter ATP-binding protein [Hoyosella rhizosphaerae]MBN4927199.1 ABC transporter ATP-binding protein [Hoyosella rhizosphaerae]GGC53216.1 ABC transporter ATP-binding protein [Hoyosella rhizosphaerae]